MRSGGPQPQPQAAPSASASSSNAKRNLDFAPEDDVLLGDTGGEGSAPPKPNLRVLAPPTTFRDIFYAVFLQVMRKYLWINIYKKVVYYVTIVIVGSLFAATLKTVNISSDENRWYFAKSRFQKSNILNQLFVKWGWAWTLMLLSPFVYMTSVVYSSNNGRNIRQQLARLFVATLLWYFCTSMFVNIERQTGRCSLPKLNGQGKRACASLEGGVYTMGFDISGHCFMLIYCVLVIMEEAKVFRNWDKMTALLQSKDEPEMLAIDDQDALTSLTYHREYTPVIKYLFMALGALVAIWDFMIIITIIYYHTMPHKVLGMLVGIGCWALTYKGWYTTSLSPGLPGHGQLRYSGWRKKL